MAGLIHRWRTLRERGVIGMNERNGEFILPHNPRSEYPRVDDKLTTKKLAQKAGIKVPELLGVVSHYHELRKLPETLAGLDAFVLKPSKGAQGNGIMVIRRGDDGVLRRANGREVSHQFIHQHVSSTLSGVFSLRGDWDSCLIEQIIETHPDFGPVAPLGLPDIRIVVYLGIPVMAMCRLPTLASNGRANLHQGAIGVGIDMLTGRGVHAIHHDRSLAAHVDTGKSLTEFHIPMWDDVVGLAARASEISSLGYLGVDVVVDAEHGPLLLELNARPGLAIQLANKQGLRPRLKRVEEANYGRGDSWQSRLQLSRELLSH